MKREDELYGMGPTMVSGSKQRKLFGLVPRLLPMKDNRIDVEKVPDEVLIIGGFNSNFVLGTVGLIRTLTTLADVPNKLMPKLFLPYVGPDLGK